MPGDAYLKDRDRWHRELLEKMLIEVPPVRPRVMPLDNRVLLADLLGFRHVFRHAYEFRLDEAKTVGLWRRWQGEGGQIKASRRAFAEALANAATSGEEDRLPAAL